MRTRRRFSILLVAAMATLLCLPLVLNAALVELGTAGSFAVLGGSTVTNTGPTVITGNLGVSPGTAITGFPPGIVNGTQYPGTSEAAQAQSDALAAYNALAGMEFDHNLDGQNLGGLTLIPGVYNFSSSAFLTGTLTLDAQGKSDAFWAFQMGSTLITASDSAVVVSNPATGWSCCDNLFWQVGSSATLGTGTDFVGNIIANTSVTMTTGATIDEGRVFALNGAVTLDSNTIAICDATPVPVPAAMWLLGSGLAVLAGVRKSVRK